MRRVFPLVAALIAAGGIARLPAAAKVNLLPQEHKQAGVAYMSGGIGSDEAAEMRRAAARYPLELEFVQHALPKDEYLAGVAVTIRDRAGKTVLATTSEGPFLLAKLPPGKYTIEADHNGQVKERQASVLAHKHERLVFEWPK